jgi:hypothetical protein
MKHHSFTFTIVFRIRRSVKNCQAPAAIEWNDTYHDSRGNNDVGRDKKEKKE